MKYLRKFETEADVNMSVTPNVVLVGETGKVVYNAFNGVYIQHIDGSLYTTDEWTAKGFANEQANGVAVGKGSAKFVIAKEYINSYMAWSSDTSNLVNGIVTTEDSSVAKKDYDGAKNTKLIAAIDTSKAAYSCANYVFPNGQKGYLPALGEWMAAAAYKTKIDNAMTLIGGIAISSQSCWSSTQLSATAAWIYNWNYGYTNNMSKNSAGYVRAFSALTL